MYREFFAGMEWTGLALGAMLFFLAFFLAVVARVLLVRRSERDDAMARLPLDEPIRETPSTDRGEP